MVKKRKSPLAMKSSSVGATTRTRYWIGKFVRKHKLLVWVLKGLTNVIVFFVLCLTGPNTATLYFRKGKYNGLTRCDWILFILATLVANLYWILGIMAVIEGGRRILFGP